MDGWIAIYSVELAYYLSYVVVWEQGMVGCHACPLGHFINSARGQVTLYMMASRYSRLVRGMAATSGSCRCRVGLQSTADWLAQSAAGSRPDEQSDGEPAGAAGQSD